jgi:hypothetical protein
MKTTVSSSYIITRTLIAAGLGALIGWKTYWWSGVLTGAAALTFFLWATRSGRYMVQANGGVAPMRLDERTRTIRDRAAKNAFVVLMLALAALVLYFGLVQPGNIPTQMLLGVLGLGFLSYFVSDVLQRQNPGG